MVLSHIKNKTMKATNIYQSLKSKGVCGTDGIAPKLPGMKSPLKKSPYKFNAGLKEAAAEGKLDENPKFKAAVESSPATMKDNGKKATLISEKKDPKTGITTKKYDVGTNMPKIVRTKKKPSSPANKGCSPAKLVPEEVEGRKPNTRKNKARRGVRAMLGGLANANRGCKPHRKIKGY